MTTSRTPDDAVIGELLQLEERRCRANASGDIVALAPLLADDYTLTHMNGRSEDKAALLASRASGPRFTMESKDLTVRVYGNVAVITGIQVLRFAEREPLESAVSQVWVKRELAWQQVLWQGTRVQG
jgi:Domain of unknown function (DUF4440)